MDTIREITSKIHERHRNIISNIEEFPEILYVGKCNNGNWSKLTYPKFGLGLACFWSKADSETWYSSPNKHPLILVKMVKSEAIKLAKKENLKYLHLLSNDISTPLNHLKIS